MEINVDVRKVKNDRFLITFGAVHKDKGTPLYIFPLPQLAWPLDFWVLSDYYHTTTLEAVSMEIAHTKVIAVVARIMNIVNDFSISIVQRYVITF